MIYSSTAFTAPETAVYPVSNSPFNDFSSAGSKVHLQCIKNENQKLKTSSKQLSVLDIASYITAKTGMISAEKLQKLIYYCQAWSLVWDDMPLFYEDIEARRSGPVVRKLFNFCQGSFMIERIPVGSPDLLNEKQKETIDSILTYYGDKSSLDLGIIVRMEKPWADAAAGSSMEAGRYNTISLESMFAYYSSLT